MQPNRTTAFPFLFRVVFVRLFSSSFFFFFMGVSLCMRSLVFSKVVAVVRPLLKQSVWVRGGGSGGGMDRWF